MYLERPASARLRAIVSCTWQHATAHPRHARVVPDACMDILWNGRQLLVAGPDTAPVSLALPGGTRIVGVRFLPGAGGPLLGTPASALCDARVPLTELWGDAARTLEDGLEQAGDVHAAWRLLERALEGRHAQAAAVDPLMRAVLAWLQPCAAESSSVAALAQRAGVSERQLLRRARAAFGYGPKLLTRILRFQALRAALRARPQASLAQLALELGYADQAHLTHDVSELAGVTPSQWKREAMSDFDKTAPGSRPQNAPYEDHRREPTRAR